MDMALSAGLKLASGLTGDSSSKENDNGAEREMKGKYQEESSQLAKHNASQQEEIKRLSVENAKLEAKNKYNKKKLQEKISDLKQRDDEITTLKHHKASLENDLELVKQQKQQLQLNYDERIKEHDDYKTRVEIDFNKCRAMIVKKETEIKDISQVNSELETCIQKETRKSMELQSKLSNAVENLESKGQELSALKEKYRSLKTDAGEVKRELENKDKTIAELKIEWTKEKSRQQQQDVIEQKHREYSNKIQTLTKDVKIHEEEIRQLTENKNELESNMKNIMNENKKHKKENVDYLRTIYDNETEIEKITKTIQELRRKYQKETDALFMTNDKFARAVKELSDERAKVNQLQEGNETFRENLEKVIEEQNQLNVKFQQQLSLTDEENKKFLRGQFELEETKKEQRRMEMLFNEIRNKVQKIKESFDSYTEIKETIVGMLDTLNNEKEAVESDHEKHLERKAELEQLIREFDLSEKKMERSLESQRIECVSFDNEISHLEKRLGELRNEMNIKTNRRHSVLEQIRSLDVDLKRKFAELKQLETPDEIDCDRFQSSTGFIVRDKNQKKDYENAERALNDDIEKLGMNIDTNERNLSAMKRKKTEALQQIKDLQKKQEEMVQQKELVSFQYTTVNVNIQEVTRIEEMKNIRLKKVKDFLNHYNEIEAILQTN